MHKILVIGGDGYIGSVLTSYLRHQGYVADVMDIKSISPKAYQTGFVRGHNILIHLAAHSSVAACEKDPRGAVNNNLLDLSTLIGRLGEDQTFIFASTGSVFDINTSNLYDATKRAAEAIISVMHPKSYVVRFGTVCGVSPNMREDLILNGMVRDAIRQNAITVKNPGAWRPVLFFPDLCYGIEQLLDGTAPYGVYNLASFQARIGGWADMVAKQLGAEIIDGGVSPHYNFSMPILPKGLTTPEAVINELAEYWRAHS